MLGGPRLVEEHEREHRTVGVAKERIVVVKNPSGVASPASHLSEIGILERRAHHPNPLDDARPQR